MLTDPEYKVGDRVYHAYTDEPGVVKAVSDPDSSLPYAFWVRMEDGYYVTCYASDLESAHNG